MVLIEQLKQVKETRSHVNQCYPVLEIVFLVISAMICGQKHWSDIEDFGNGNLDWLRQYLPYENGIPTRHNIARIMRMVVPESLLLALVGWVNSFREASDVPILSLDGKAIRGAKASRQDNPLFVVSAFASDEGLVLYHQACEGKGKELQAVRDMLSILDVDGCLLTADALHCQPETFALAQNKGADFLVQVKKNQPSLFDEVDLQFQAYWEQPEEVQDSLETTDKGHGRIESRVVYSLPANLSPGLRKKWPAIKGVIAVVRDRTEKGRVGSFETSYYVCSSHLSLELASQSTRKHWHTENQQHWALDVIFREDEQTIYAGDAPLNMASCRRFALNIFNQDKSKLSIPRKMNKAIWDADYRSEILFTWS